MVERVDYLGTLSLIVVLIATSVRLTQTIQKINPISYSQSFLSCVEIAEIADRHPRRRLQGIETKLAPPSDTLF